MKNNWIIWLVVLLIIGGGIWYFAAPKTAASPATAAGLNGSNDQGNLGGADTGTPQDPGSEERYPIIGSNLALGIDGAGTNKHLIGYNGKTVYINAQDMTTTSTCNDACATTWPPYIVSPIDNIKQLQAGVTGTVGKSIRADGQFQLTYNDHPLYFYSGDTTGSDTKGNGVGNGQWAMVKI